jgi:hypothetical protein
MMRRLIFQTSISIDGYVAALDGSHSMERQQRPQLVDATRYETRLATHVDRPHPAAKSTN